MKVYKRVCGRETPTFRLYDIQWENSDVFKLKSTTHATINITANQLHQITESGKAHIIIEIAVYLITQCNIIIYL